jgi:hypothetical protein
MPDYGTSAYNQQLPYSHLSGIASEIMAKDQESANKNYPHYQQQVSRSSSNNLREIAVDVIDTTPASFEQPKVANINSTKVHAPPLSQSSNNPAIVTTSSAPAVTAAMTSTEKQSSSVSTSVPPSSQRQYAVSPAVTQAPPNHNLLHIMEEAATYDAQVHTQANAIVNNADKGGLVVSIPLEVIANRNNANNIDLVSQLGGEIAGEDKQYGLVKLTVHYDELRSRLSVTVHEAR